jgi:TolB-like protein
MSSLIPGYSYDIFISYRQKDNKHDGWVTEFVNNLKGELESTFKEEISVYFDINPHDGLLETYDVDESLKSKLKSLIFIPIISRTYCDPNSFAWEHEFKAFVERSSQDQFGLKIKLPNGNVATRVLPVRIYDLDSNDIKLCESILGGVLRGIEFIYKEPGVNRPLKPDDDEKINLNKAKYRNQINKVANAIKEIVTGIRQPILQHEDVSNETFKPKFSTSDKRKLEILAGSLIILTLIILGYFFVPKLFKHSDKFEKTIAVLPFVDLSPNHDKEYFSDGMVDEILNKLYKIGDLKVTSRTSSMKYKGETKKSVREIAKELEVANILEGSVRLYHDTVRITVQLIKTETDEHLWAGNFDRDFSDIFSIQSEVALKVAKTLKAEISPETERIIGLRPTSNLEAYNLYLKAWSLNLSNEDGKIKAMELFNKAIKLDPSYGGAYISIGIILTLDAGFISSSKVGNIHDTWEIAKPYYEKALVLNPDDARAHDLFATALLYFEWNFKAADKEYQEARRIFPNYCWSDYLIALGQFKEAYEGAINNLNLDPKNAFTHAGIILSSYFVNRDPESEIMKALKTPTIGDNISVRSESARVYMYMKEYDKAISIAKQVLKDIPSNESPRLEAIQAISYFNANRPDETIRIIEKLKQISDVNVGGSPSFYIAMIYSQMGERNEAFNWLEKAYRNHEVEMYWLKVEPPFEPLHSDSRFQVMLDKIGFP